MHTICTVITVVMSLVLTHKVHGQQDKKKVSDLLPDSVAEERFNVKGFPYLMVEHGYKKYALAMRWNDGLVARNTLYDIILANPEADSTIFSLAYLYYENGAYTSAALVCRDLLDRDPKNLNYLGISAASLESIGALSRALQNYETLYLLSDNTATLYKVALLQYRLKLYNEGLTNADILLTKPNIDSLQIEYQDDDRQLKNYSMKPVVINLKGLLYEAVGDPVQAKQMYERALQVDVNFMPAKNNLDKLN